VQFTFLTLEKETPLLFFIKLNNLRQLKIRTARDPARPRCKKEKKEFYLGV